MASARSGLVVAVLVTISLVPPLAGTAGAAGAEPPRNPHLGPNGTATMHGDSASSDTTPYAGPGPGPVDARYIPLAGACPTVLVGQDGYPVALRTSLIDRAPTVYLLDPGTGAPLATMRLDAGELLGGVYAYLDAEDLLVAVDGSGDLLYIGHRLADSGVWELYVARRVPIGVPGVVSVMPDWQGRVWFTTADARVGYVDSEGRHSAALELPAGERVSNSISTTPQGTAVVTDQALYLLATDRRGDPEVLWRQPYDRGPARKPGQLSWGSGATPTFFGGMTRVDLRPDGTGCDVRWQSTVRSAAVPRLSLADGYLYTITREGPLDGGDTTPLDSYRTAVIDQHTGELVGSEQLGTTGLFDTLQMVGTIDARGVQYQGTLTGIVRIAAR